MRCFSSARCFHRVTHVMTHRQRLTYRRSQASPGGVTMLHQALSPCPSLNHLRSLRSPHHTESPRTWHVPKAYTPPSTGGQEASYACFDLVQIPAAVASPRRRNASMCFHSYTQKSAIVCLYVAAAAAAFATVASLQSRRCRPHRTASQDGRIRSMASYGNVLRRLFCVRRSRLLGCLLAEDRDPNNLNEVHPQEPILRGYSTREKSQAVGVYGR